MNMHTPELTGDVISNPFPRPVRRFLDLSTGHLKPETRTMLDLICDAQERGDLSAWAACTAFGWFVWADEEAVEGQYPPDMLACMAKAREMGCDYILFDRDASQAPDILGLPFYDECRIETTSHCPH